MLIVEVFNNGPACHGHDELLHPDDVKEAFNKAFEGENKSAVVTRLMRRAIEENERNRDRRIRRALRNSGAAGPTDERSGAGGLRMKLRGQRARLEKRSSD
jgi:hypothetical protein